MKIAFVVYIVCIMLSVLMQAVEEQQEGYKNDSKRSPSERHRACRRYNFARLMKRLSPVLGFVYLILYLFLSKNS